MKLGYLCQQIANQRIGACPGTEPRLQVIVCRYLTGAAIETLSVLAEARMDGEVLSGAEIEAVISGRNAADCEEAAGATRIGASASVKIIGEASSALGGGR